MNTTKNEMGRRSLMKWLSGLLAACNAAMIGVPTLSYAMGSLQKQTRQHADFRRVARLKDLPESKPVMIPIIGQRQDAWTLQPSELIGRVWLTRGAIDEADPAKTELSVLTGLCTHLGCAIELTSDGQRFACPCHSSLFTLTGERIEPESGLPCPAPRGMDPLQYQLVQVSETQEWWVEVKYEVFQLGTPERKVVA